MKDFKLIALIAVLCLLAGNGFFDSTLGVNPKLPAEANATQGGQGDAKHCSLSKDVINVVLDDDRYPYLAAHIRDVRSDYPWVLTVDRDGADAHRDQSLRGIPTKPGYDRDEYPPAMSREGGEGAHVAYVPSSENRSGGSYMSHILRPYCSGQRFRLLASN